MNAIASMPAVTARPRSSFTYFGYALFVPLGIVTTLLGPILPLLTVRWTISSAQAGQLFSWQFVASTLGTLISGLLLSKRGFRIPIAMGTALCLFGVAILIRADWALGRYAVACYGFGLGTSLPAVNLGVAEANARGRAGSVSLLNFCWGIGAIAAPVLLRGLRSLDAFLLSVCALLVVGIVGAMLFRMPERRQGQRLSEPGRVVLGTALVLAALMFLLCGVENSVGGWASTLALPSFSSAYTAATANIAFWAFFLASRALAPIVLRKVSEAWLLVASIAVASAGVLAFYFAGGAIAILLACGLAGLGIGPGFPLLISRVSSLIGSENPAATVCFAFAGFGAATLPNLMGLVGSRSAQPRFELIVPFLGLILALPLLRRGAARQ